jgi:hypothetical protein
MVGLAINVINGYVMNAKKTQPVKSVWAKKNKL